MGHCRALSMISERKGQTALWGFLAMLVLIAIASAELPTGTPPITVIAMASSSYITPMPAWAVRFLELSTIAATAARMPAIE